MPNKEYYPLGGLDNAGQISVVSTRPLGNMSLVYGDTSMALANRKVFLAGLGIDYRDLVCAKQIHGDSVSCIKEEDRGRGALSYDSAVPDTDALVTDRKNLPLAVFTADCLSVFLYDPLRPAIGLVHAGWKGSRNNITARTVWLMQRIFRTKTTQLYAGFGPSMRSCCYEVGKDFQESFREGLIKRSNRYYLDLAQINKKQLLDLAVKEERILDSGLCTSCALDDFFSFRKEAKACGRLISVMMLAG